MKLKPFIIIFAISLLSSLLFSSLFFAVFLNIGNRISSKFNRPISYFPDVIFSAIESHIKQPIVSRNFIILGADKREDSIEKNEMTDTIIFTSLSVNDSKLTLIPIPRDLWFEDIQGKVNSIYELSKTNNNGSVDYKFIKDKYSNLLGQDIDRVIVTDTNDLIELVNLIGGVELYLENGFIDHQYPNPDYISNPSKDIPIYKTIEFPSGLIKLDSGNITEFVRSRKGSDDPLKGGTDLGRMARQQLLIDALVQKISSPEMRNLNKIASLYNFFYKNIETDLTDLDVSQIALALGKNISSLKFNKIDIPTSTHSASNVIIYHPSRFKNSQWVFVPVDSSLEKMHQFISESLSVNEN